MRRTTTALGCLFLAWASGCGGCGETGETSSLSTSSGSGSGASGGAGGAGGVGGQSGVGGEGGGFVGGCASGIVCGSGECCDAGQECAIGACLDTCASSVRCGADLSTCCADGEVCIADKCAPPGGKCLDWADCEEDEFCEPILSVCIPQPPAGSATCEYKPDAGPLTPVLEWSWTGSDIMPAFDQVINMPVVVDLEKDGTPDVVIVTSDGFSAAGAAYVRALNGKDGKEKWDAKVDVYNDAYRAQPRATPAAADIDGDGLVEIVTAKMGGGLIAYEHDGKYKWSSTNADGTPWVNKLESVAVAIADIEGDGKPEIVAGGAVFEANGKLRFDGGAYFGANSSTYGAVSIVADLDGKMPQEIVGGQRALRSDGKVYWENKNLTDGYPAIADLDLDGTPELVVVAKGAVRVQRATTGEVLAEVTMPGTGAGGPPTIADFDADGIPEISAANGSAYAVFEYVSKPAPKLTVKWEKTTQDTSSNRTGSSVFDFQGDGVA
jgi:hypothetical protein